MRADRLISLLMLLGDRGRLTAETLADELEVSPRTVLRDVESLAFAGVPIHTVRGIGGGIELREGFTSALTALNSEEAACLPLAGMPDLAAPLGLTQQTERARQKLMAALSAEHETEARATGEWLHVDHGYAAATPPENRLARIVDAIRERRAIELQVVEGSLERLEPLGVVATAGGWFVVGDQPHPRAVAVDDIQRLRVTRELFERPRAFDLAAAWRAR